MKKIILVLGLVFGTVAYAKSTLDTKMQSFWYSLPASETSCDSFDYFPDGGIRSFWCHISGVNLMTLEQLTGEKVYISGPHQKGFEFQNTNDFGHYNPKFIDNMIELSIPGPDDLAFVRSTQLVYDKYVQKLARIHYVTYAKLDKNKACAQKELSLYKKEISAAVKSKNTMETAIGSFEVEYYERWYYFMNKEFCQNSSEEYLSNNGFDDGGYNGNVVKSVVGFWLRREMDGTKLNFVTGLKKLLGQYDAKWLSSQQ